jgi:hypothetical protein
VLVRLSGLKRSLANTNNQRESTQETHDFYPVVRPSNTCLLPCCGIPMDEGCTQPLSSDPMINLNTTVFSFLVFSRLQGISTTWSLSPLQWWSQKKHRSKGGESNTHKTQIIATITHTSHNSSSKHNAQSSKLKWSSSHYLKESNARTWSLGVLECFL